MLRRRPDRRPIAVVILLLGFAAVAPPAHTAGASSDSLQQQEIQAARACFRTNLEAIRNRDRDAYLATYWHSESLARNGWAGVQRGFAGHAANAGGDDWPDVFDAQQMQLVWLRPGLVYGSYRYRVVYGIEESSGISERVFLKTDAGWRIAVTSAFGSPEGTPPPPLALVGGTLLDIEHGTRVTAANLVMHDGRITCAGAADACRVPDGSTVVDVSGRWLVPGLIDSGVFFARSSGLDAFPAWGDLQEPDPDVQAALQHDVAIRLRAWLRCGVTSVVDRGGPAWTWQLRASTSTRRPHVAAVGPVLVSQSRNRNLPTQMSSIVLPVMRRERLIPRAVRTLHAQGSDAVVYRWTPATAQIAVIPRGDTSRRERALLTRVAEEVHITGLPLVVEAGCLDGAAAAIASGARVIVDVWSDTLDTAFLRDAADAGVFYGTSIVAVQNELRLLDAIATRQRLSIDDPLAVLDSVTAMHLSRASEWPLSHDEPTRLRTMRSRLQQHLDRLRSNLVAAHRAGLRLVAASGAGRALTLHGTALNTELEAWQACGIPPGAILRAATVDAADAWPALERRGRLDAGAVADVLILHEDPSRDIHNLRRLDAVVRGGELRWQRESTTTAVDD